MGEENESSSRLFKIIAAILVIWGLMVLFGGVGGYYSAHNVIHQAVYSVRQLVGLVLMIFGVFVYSNFA